MMVIVCMIIPGSTADRPLNGWSMTKTKPMKAPSTAIWQPRMIARKRVRSMLLLTNSSNRTANPIASQKIADSDTVTAFSRESRLGHLVERTQHLGVDRDLSPRQRFQCQHAARDEAEGPQGLVAAIAMRQLRPFVTDDWPRIDRKSTR